MRLHCSGAIRPDWGGVGSGDTHTGAGDLNMELSSEGCWKGHIAEVCPDLGDGVGGGPVKIPKITPTAMMIRQ